MLSACLVNADDRDEEDVKEAVERVLHMHLNVYEFSDRVTYKKLVSRVCTGQLCDHESEGGLLYLIRVLDTVEGSFGKTARLRYRRAVDAALWSHSRQGNNAGLRRFDDAGYFVLSRRAAHTADFWRAKKKDKKKSEPLDHSPQITGGDCRENRR